MFVSVTDTGAERQALRETVYPKLREFCRENYGLEFQVRVTSFPCSSGKTVFISYHSVGATKANFKLHVIFISLNMRKETHKMEMIS